MYAQSVLPFILDLTMPTLQAYLIVFWLQLYDAIEQGYSSLLDWDHPAGLVHERRDLRIRVPHKYGVYRIKGSSTQLAVFKAVEEVWQSKLVSCPTCRKLNTTVQSGGDANVHMPLRIRVASQQSMTPQLADCQCSR